MQRACARARALARARARARAHALVAVRVPAGCGCVARLDALRCDAARGGPALDRGVERLSVLA
eukprot:787036-Pleurochrysis_carterae.AAC.1